MTPKAIVIRTAGTNCDREMLRAFELAGATPHLLHLDRLLADPARLEEADLIGFPGGFSHGDDLGAGRVFAVRLRERLLPALRAAAQRGVPMIGACNGFQVLVQTGLLPGGPHDQPADASARFEPSMQTAALGANSGGRFIDAWLRVRFEPASVCVWTAGLAHAALSPDEAMLPIAHGEGRFITASPAVMTELEQRGQIALRYVDNVNGSAADVAGICDPTGRIFGLMPHPERFLSWVHHPYWTRLAASQSPHQRAATNPEPLGLRIFRNAVAAVSLAAAI